MSFDKSAAHQEVMRKLLDDYIAITEEEKHKQQITIHGKNDYVAHLHSRLAARRSTLLASVINSNTYNGHYYCNIDERQLRAIIRVIEFGTYRLTHSDFHQDPSMVPASHSSEAWWHVDMYVLLQEWGIDTQLSTEALFHATGKLLDTPDLFYDVVDRIYGLPTSTNTELRQVLTNVVAEHKEQFSKPEQTGIGPRAKRKREANAIKAALRDGVRSRPAFKEDMSHHINDQDGGYHELFGLVIPDAHPNTCLPSMDHARPTPQPSGPSMQQHGPGLYTTNNQAGPSTNDPPAEPNDTPPATQLSILRAIFTLKTITKMLEAGPNGLALAHNLGEAFATSARHLITNWAQVITTMAQPPRHEVTAPILCAEACAMAFQEGQPYLASFLSAALETHIASLVDGRDVSGMAEVLQHWYAQPGPIYRELLSSLVTACAERLRGVNVASEETRMVATLMEASSGFAADLAAYCRPVLMVSAPDTPVYEGDMDMEGGVTDVAGEVPEMEDGVTDMEGRVRDEPVVKAIEGAVADAGLDDLSAQMAKPWSERGMDADEDLGPRVPDMKMGSRCGNKGRASKKK